MININTGQATEAFPANNTNSINHHSNQCLQDAACRLFQHFPSTSILWSSGQAPAIHQAPARDLNFILEDK
jgi:hypothetical protein